MRKYSVMTWIEWREMGGKEMNYPEEVNEKEVGKNWIKQKQT